MSTTLPGVTANPQSLGQRAGANVGSIAVGLVCALLGFGGAYKGIGSTTQIFPYINLRWALAGVGIFGTILAGAAFMPPSEGGSTTVAAPTAVPIPPTAVPPTLAPTPAIPPPAATRGWSSWLPWNWGSGDSSLDQVLISGKTGTELVKDLAEFIKDPDSEPDIKRRAACAIVKNAYGADGSAEAAHEANKAFRIALLMGCERDILEGILEGFQDLSEIKSGTKDSLRALIRILEEAGAAPTDLSGLRSIREDRSVPSPARRPSVVEEEDDALGEGGSSSDLDLGIDPLEPASVSGSEFDFPPLEEDAASPVEAKLPTRSPFELDEAVLSGTIRDVVEGSGPEIKSGQTVVVHWKNLETGIDGNSTITIDGNQDENLPFLGDAVKGMNVGGKRTFKTDGVGAGDREFEVEVKPAAEEESILDDLDDFDSPPLDESSSSEFELSLDEDVRSDTIKDTFIPKRGPEAESGETVVVHWRNITTGKEGDSTVTIGGRKDPDLPFLGKVVEGMKVGGKRTFTTDGRIGSGDREFEVVLKEIKKEDSDSLFP